MLGPLLGWINVLEAHVRLGLELPVNLRFCFEGEEQDSDFSPAYPNKVTP